MPLPVFIISIILFFLLFFGIGFVLNMLFRSSWIMVILFPMVAVFIVNQLQLIEYVRQPVASFQKLGNSFAALHSADLIILSSGLLGGVLAGVVMKQLRKKGYRMF
jgi:Putative membrane protein